MAATLTRPPFHRDGWVYEEEVDGWRMLGDADTIAAVIAVIALSAGR